MAHHGGRQRPQTYEDLIDVPADRSMSDRQRGSDVGSDRPTTPVKPGGARAHFVAAADAKAREFLGIPFDLLAVGEKLMITRMRYGTGMTVARHAHENEQARYVLSGRYRQIIDGTTYELCAGDSYAIPGRVDYAIEVLEGGQVIDVFTPPARGLPVNFNQKWRPPSADWQAPQFHLMRGTSLCRRCIRGRGNGCLSTFSVFETIVNFTQYQRSPLGRGRR